MQSQAKLKRHAALFDTMAQVHGLDLEEQMLRGKLTFNELDDAVMRCTACTGVESCAHWLATRQDVDVQAPHYCRNAALFRDLDRG